MGVTGNSSFVSSVKLELQRNLCKIGHLKSLSTYCCHCCCCCCRRRRRFAIDVVDDVVIVVVVVVVGVGVDLVVVVVIVVLMQERQHHAHHRRQRSYVTTFKRITGGGGVDHELQTDLTCMLSAEDIAPIITLDTSQSNVASFARRSGKLGWNSVWY